MNIESQESTNPSFEIVEEKLVYKRYIRVFDRKTRFPNKREVNWDVVSHGRPYVCVFPFNSKTKSVTLLKEYCQGPNQLLYGLPCGSYESSKHFSPLHAAQNELSEEAELKGGTWLSLLQKEKEEGIVEVKWCANRFYPFVVIDPYVDSSPLPRDEEEYILIERDISLERMKELILKGEMMLPSVQTCLMALNFLKENNYLQQNDILL